MIKPSTKYSPLAPVHGAFVDTRRSRYLVRYAAISLIFMGFLFACCFRAGAISRIFGVAPRRNVIFMVSDGFGPASETYAREFAQHMYSTGRAGPDWKSFPSMLPLDSIMVGQSRTRSADSWVTDSAAGATAFSCGLKTYNGAIGVNSSEAPCVTVFEAAKLEGYMTAMVVTSRITHATPAAFSSHITWRDYEEEIAVHQIKGAAFGPSIDLMFGGGLCNFLSNSTHGSCRTDNIDLRGDATAKFGFSKFVSNKKEFEALSGDVSELPLVALFSDDHMSYEIDRDPSRQPSLLEMTKKALDYMTKATENTEKGFAMLIEGSRIDMAAHENDAAAHAHEILSYQKTIEYVKRYVEEHPGTVIVSVSDHETGGLTLGRQLTADYPKYIWYPEVIAGIKNSTEAIVPMILNTPAETRADFVRTKILPTLVAIHDFTDADVKYLSDPAMNRYQLMWYLGEMINRRALLGWSTHGHTGVDVNLYAYAGKNNSHLIEAIRRNLENIELETFMQAHLGISEDIMAKANQKLLAAWKAKKFLTHPAGKESKPRAHSGKQGKDTNLLHFHNDDVLIPSTTFTGAPNWGLVNQSKAPVTAFLPRSAKSALLERIERDAAAQQKPAKSPTTPSVAALSDEAEKHFIGPKPSKDGSDVIVLQPGSRNLYVGRASDAFPIAVPHVVAKRVFTSVPVEPELAVNMDEMNQFADDMEELIHARLKEIKLRAAQNGLQQVISFNTSNEVPNKIADHNDPYRIEWLQPSTLPDAVYGEQALQIPLEDSSFHLFHPVEYGELNTVDYLSREALACDMEGIWTHALRSELNIQDFRSFNALLIVPDMIQRADLQFYIEVLSRMNFNAFSIQQESFCSAFGAGMTCACVVDVGAQTSKIACIDDGFVVPETRIELKMGGDDITKTLSDILIHRAEFPYKDIDLRRYHDFSTMESLKEHYCLQYEGDVVLAQIYDCYIRIPNKQTLLYKFKICEEAMIPTLALYFPREFMFDNRAKLVANLGFENAYKPDEKLYKSSLPFHEKVANTTHEEISSEPARHPYYEPDVEYFNEDARNVEEAPLEPEAVESATPDLKVEATALESTAVDVLISLDQAIVKSIVSYCSKLVHAIQTPDNTETPSPLSAGEEDKIRRMFGTILLVGGGLANFPGVSRFLQDRVNAALQALIPPKLNLVIAHVGVIISPRDMDCRFIAWKGGAVSSRIESMSRECWTSMTEWRAFGTSCAEERLLFRLFK